MQFFINYLNTTVKRFSKSLLMILILVSGSVIAQDDLIWEQWGSLNYQSSETEAEFLKKIAGSSDTFLRNISSGSPPCSDSSKRRFRFFESVVKFVPGTGSFSDLLAFTEQVATYSLCQNDGKTRYSWDEIMEEVDRRIGIAIAEEKRQQMRDAFSFFLSSYADLYEPLAEIYNNEVPEGMSEENHEEAIQNSIESLSGVLEKIINDLELYERTLGFAETWTDSIYLPHHETLKSLSYKTLIELQLMVDNNDYVTKNLLNLRMEKSRKLQLQSIYNVEEDFDHIRGNSKIASLTYIFKKNRSGIFGTYKRSYKMAMWDASGLNQLKDENQNTELSSSCNGICSGGVDNWYDKRDSRWNNAKQMYKDLWDGIWETRNESYRRFVDRVSYFKGDQLFFVPWQVSGKPYCLTAGAFVGDERREVEINECSYGTSYSQTDLVNNELSDSWRVHEKTGLLIHEASGLCLDVDESDNAVFLSACQYKLDSEREENTTQEWAIAVPWLLVNRNTGECLSADDNKTSVYMSACDPHRMKNVYRNYNGDNTKVYSMAMESNWQKYVLDCEDEDQCALRYKSLPTMYTSYECNTVRHVLPADLAKQYSSAEFIDTEDGYSDSGFMLLKGGANVIHWGNQEMLKGKYTLTVYYRGTENNVSGTTGKIRLLSNNKRVAQIEDVPLIGPGEVNKFEVNIELPDFTRRFSVTRFGSGEYLIDKVILSPVVEGTCIPSI